MNRQRLDQVMGGHATDIRARITRAGLGALEPVYRTIAKTRNRSFDQHPTKTSGVAACVISIGNLTTGGTGKTPVVRWIVQQMNQLGRRPAIVSRGYGAKQGQPNDEYHELKLFLPNTPHVQNPDRVIAANQAIKDHQADVIILDDGFQHRRIARDLDIVLIDATCPFGFGHLLPRGLLREPVESLRRADAAVVTRVDQVSESFVDEIENQIKQFVPENRIAKVSFPASHWVSVDGEEQPLSALAMQPVFAFCGIGNPVGFEKAINSHCQNVTGFRSFPDHHDYDANDLLAVQKQAKESGATQLACTVKDLVKLRDLPASIQDAFPLTALSISAKLETGETMLSTLMQSCLKDERVAEKEKA